MGIEVSAAVDRKSRFIRLGHIVVGVVPFFAASDSIAANHSTWWLLFGVIVGVPIIAVGIIGIVVGIVIGARAGGILSRIGGGIGGFIVCGLIIAGIIGVIIRTDLVLYDIIKLGVINIVIALFTVGIIGGTIGGIVGGRAGAIFGRR